MMKRELPSNWITVNSKSHPDRIYYFNVKTKQSSWILPLDETNNKTSPIKNKRKIGHEEKKHQTPVTLEPNVVDDKTVLKQQSSKKIIETPQMKAIREKMLQKLTAGNKSSVLPTKPSAKLTESKTSFCSRTSKLTKSDESISVDKNYNEVTFTPQMSVLYEKIQQRNSNKSNQEKKAKMSAKSKQQDLNITNQVLVKKQEKSPRQRETLNQRKNNVEQCPNNKTRNAQKLHSPSISRKKEPRPLLQKKNIAKERMRILRRNLSLDKETLKEVGRVVQKEKTSQKLSRSLPNSNNHQSSTYVYKNAEVRLTRLRNKILKEFMYKNKNNILNDDKSHSQQKNELVVNNMTKEKLIEQAKQEILYEEMDWEPMGDDAIAQEVEVVRTELGKIDRVRETNCILGNTVELIQPNETESQEKSPLYIVVDTNVFLSNLQIIEEARDATFKNYPRPFIVIPWTVIHELDYIKSNKSAPELWMKARKAISFIHEHFSSKHPRIIGQTREQAEKNKDDFSLSCPDDEILQCCLQICQLQKSVVLLSYDKNLCNKAMLYNLLALGRNDPLEKIDYYNINDTVNNNLNTSRSIGDSLFNEELHLTDDIFESTKATMKDFLSTIISKQMSESYGEVEWKLYVIIKPPWTIVTALKCAIKHWIAAINESFQRRAECILKELLQVFEHLPDGGRKLEDVEHVLERCSDLVQAVKADKHCQLMSETFDAITELKKKCRNYIFTMQQKRLHDKIGIVEDVQEQEMRAQKVFQCFQHIYNYARDICGTVCSNAGIAHSFNFEPVNLSLLPTPIEYLRPELARNVADLTQSLNKLLLQAENTNIQYQSLLSLQQNLDIFLPYIERITFDVTPLDVYYCIKLKEEPLKTGLKQLQDLTRHFCALAVHT